MARTPLAAFFNRPLQAHEHFWHVTRNTEQTGMRAYPLIGIGLVLTKNTNIVGEPWALKSVNRLDLACCCNTPNFERCRLIQKEKFMEQKRKFSLSGFLLGGKRNPGSNGGAFALGGFDLQGALHHTNSFFHSNQP